MGVDYKFERNILGSVVAIWNMQTGALVGRYGFDAWGNQVYMEVAGGLAQYVVNRAVMEFNPFRWKGYYFDSVTGFYYLQSRYYDPVIGRFINADDPRMLFSEAMMPMGANLFMYCYNNPVMFRDDSGYGFFTSLLILGVIGALAAVGGRAAGDIMRGEISSWQEYVGAAIGGFAGGILTKFMGPMAAAMSGAFIGTTTEILLNVTTGARSYTTGQVFRELLTSVIIAGIVAGTGQIVGNLFAPSVLPAQGLLNQATRQRVFFIFFFSEFGAAFKDSILEEGFDIFLGNNASGVNIGLRRYYVV